MKLAYRATRYALLSASIRDAFKQIPVGEKQKAFGAALAGNRTPVNCVGGNYDTTTPPAPDWILSNFYGNIIYVPDIVCHS